MHEERNRILRELDVDGLIATLPTGEQLRVRAMAPHQRRLSLLAALHRARYEVTAMPRELREESRAWLQMRAIPRFQNKPWPLDGVLPEEIGG